MKKIAVQKNLTPVKNYLENQGYQVQEFEGNASQVAKDNMDAIVITGQDQNILGNETISTKVPIIEARGMKPQEIEQILKNR